MNTKDLLSVAREFRDGITGKKSSDGMCFMVCWPLCGYLNFIGEGVELIYGTVSGIRHYWIKFTNGTILDPTADQFSTVARPMPEIYIGPKPRWYKTMKKESL